MNKLYMRAFQMKARVLSVLAVGLTVSFQTGFGAGSAPTDAAFATPTWSAKLQGEQVGFDGTRWFYAPFDPTDNPLRRFLTLTDEQVYMVPIDNGTQYVITDITTTTTTDKKTGQQRTTQTTTVTTVPIDDLDLEDYLTLEEWSALWNYDGNVHYISDLEKVGPSTDPNDTSPHIYTLSDPYSPEDFIKDVVDVGGWVPAFQNTFTPSVTSAYLHLPEDKLTCSLYKLQYKWNAGDQGAGTVIWDEQFTPDDPNRPVQHHAMSWTGSGESPVFTIDPADHPTVDHSTGQTVTRQPGTYQIFSVGVVVRKIDGDNPTKPWSIDRPLPCPLYSGTSSGDMVTWNLWGMGSWPNTNYAWSAQGPESINGPSGIGKNKWEINDEDDDAAHDRVDWKPGTYTIKRQITSPEGTMSTVEFKQEVGWRTEEYAVIGQIVPTHTHDADKPGLIGSEWQFRRAVIYDFRSFFVSVIDREAASLVPVPPEKLSALWFAYWTFLRSHSQTPKGPFTSGSTAGFPFGQAPRGTVLYGHRYWMVQSLFNMAPDQPPVESQVASSNMNQIQQDGEYRIMHRYQTKFFLDANGNIRSKPITVRHVAFHGKTKAGFGLEANELYPGSPAFAAGTFPLMDSETSKVWNQHEANTSSKVSGYALARVGPKGRNANWRLVGADAPWIFSEIIHEVTPDGSVQTTHRTSVDITWQEVSGQQGTLPFNNLNIYKASVRKDDFGNVTVSYNRIKLLEMEGKMEPFINSASGQWPEPAIPPSIQ